MTKIRFPNDSVRQRCAAFLVCIRRLEVAYRMRSSDTAEEDSAIALAEWLRVFHGWQVQEVERAVDVWIDSDAKFPPRPGELLRKAADIANGTMNLSEALRLIDFARDRGLDPGTVLGDDRVAREALAIVGERITERRMDIFAAARRDFVEAWDREAELNRRDAVLRRRAIADREIGPPAVPAGLLDCVTQQLA